MMTGSFFEDSGPRSFDSSISTCTFLLKYLESGTNIAYKTARLTVQFYGITWSCF